MLEAMASGLPVFATEHGGIPEAIENGVCGVLVPEHNADELARALINAAQDSEFLSRIGRAGADSVAQKFDQRIQTWHLEDIYLQAMDVRYLA